MGITAGPKYGPINSNSVDTGLSSESVGAAAMFDEEEEAFRLREGLAAAAAAAGAEAPVLREGEREALREDAETLRLPDADDERLRAARVPPVRLDILM